MNQSLREALFLVSAAALTGLIVHPFHPHAVSLSFSRPLKLTVQDSVFVRELPAVALTPPGTAPSQPRIISFAALSELMKRNAVVLLDARSREEFASGHLQGARSMPFEQVGQYMEKIHALPHDRWLVTYCEGPPCDLSHLLANLLLQNRFELVAVYDAGLNDWQNHKGRLESGEPNE